jgi:hypothetical protein
MHPPSPGERRKLVSLIPADKACLISLLQDLRNGRPIGDQSAWLRKQVIENAEAQQLYVDSLWLTGTLSFLLKGKGASSEESPAATSTSPPRVLRFISASSMGRRLNVLGTSPIMVTLLVAMVCYGAFAILAWNLRSGALPSGAHDNDVAVAMMSSAIDVQWSSNTTSKADNASILIGEPLKIDSGTIELELSAGTKLVIEGPADWSVDGRNSVSLRSGKLLASVPEQAIGFTVETPTVTVVDLGTEFAIQVDTTGQTDVEVITGKVDIRYELLPQSDHSIQTVRMIAGNAKRFSREAADDRIAVTDVAPKMRNSPAKKSLAIVKNNSSQDLASRYAATVLADHPLGYWRLSDVGKDIAADASGHGNHGKYQGFVSRSNPGICPTENDRSVRFLGPSFKGYVQIDDFELPVSFTVELWIRSATPRWNAYGWPLSSRGPHGVVICPIGTGEGWFFLVHNARGEQRAMGPYGLENIADRFHHFVGAYDSASDQAWTYVDGKLVAQDANLLGDDRRREPVRLKFLIGKDDLGLSRDTYGDGWVDEVAIYDQALSAATIERHFNAAGLMGADEPATQVVPGNK